MNTHSRQPSIIDFGSFFEAGQEEYFSPFLTPRSRAWAFNLSLKGAIFAAVMLFLAFLTAFTHFPPPLTYLLLVFVYFFAGIPSLINSIEDLAALQINIDVLMTLAAFGSVLIGSPMEGGLLLVLFSLSGAMEDTVTRKAKSSISSLNKLSPTSASVLNQEGIATEKALSEITPRTQILVKAGQVIPLDGIIVRGSSSINLVHLTGENLPITRRPGEEVPAGALNLEGALVIEVTHTSSDSTLARIIQLVTQAQENKPKLQQWFDRLSKTYATSIILLAALFAATLPWVFGLPLLGPGGSIYRALAFLIAASPCALIIAIPIAYLSAIGACARQGIILKGGVILDALATCQVIAFDKTGTLTTGELSCLGFESLKPNPTISPDAALETAFAIEQNALHPVAKALTQYAYSSGYKPSSLLSFRSVPGYGLEASTNHGDAFIGNIEFIEPLLDPTERELLTQRISQIESRGELLAVLRIGTDLFLFRFQDQIRPEVSETLHRLRTLGYRLMMLTGDHRESAQRVASELEIDDLHARLKPEDKLDIVAREAKNRGLVMVGDGINDAPALARATVGISMGKMGNSAAIEAADVVLLQDRIDKLDWLMKKARKTRRIVVENLLIATLAIFIASIPALAGLVPLWFAVLLHEGGTVIVGLNGIRLLK